MTTTTERVRKSITEGEQGMADGTPMVTLDEALVAADHLAEYRAKLAAVAQCERSSIVSHWELGELFTRYGESFRAIADAIGASFSLVQKHALVARIVPMRERLDEVLSENPDIQIWHHLLTWAQLQSAGEKPGYEPRMSFTVPVVLTEAITARGYDAREVLRLFWQRVDPQVLIAVAYPSSVANSHQSGSVA